MNSRGCCPKCQRGPHNGPGWCEDCRRRHVEDLTKKNEDLITALRERDDRIIELVVEKRMLIDDNTRSHVRTFADAPERILMTKS